MDYVEIRDGTQPGVPAQAEPRARLKVNRDGSINAAATVFADQLQLLIEIQNAALIELRAIRALLATQVGGLEVIAEGPAIGASQQ